MIITSILLIIISNAVSLSLSIYEKLGLVKRRDISLIFNRIAIMTLILCILKEINSLFIKNDDIGLHGGLLYTTNITQTFHIFTLIISVLIIQLTSFNPNKILIENINVVKWTLYLKNIFDILILVDYYGLEYIEKNTNPKKKTELNNKSNYIELSNIISNIRRSFIKNKYLTSYMDIMTNEYPLIILFVITGAIFLISTNDLVSIFLSIELQSYGLYLLSTIYRNSELSTTGGLIYFLLGGAEWHGKLLLYCLQLSNSGDALKLKVPSCIWKDICGLANNLCTVTIFKIGETLIGNRGSKSTVVQDNAVVKEQRVDGSLCDSTRSDIRCTLRYFERYTQVGIPSNHFNLTKNRLYSTKTLLTNDCSLDLTDTKLNAVASMDPWALTGFIDGEGSFIISIIKNNENKVGWQVKLEFLLSLHEGEKVLLQSIQEYLGVGYIFKSKINKIYHYRISSTKELIKIFNHLDQFPLITKKHADYLLFKQVYSLVTNKQHLTVDGLRQIVELKASINLGLSDHLKESFPKAKAFLQLDL